MFIAFRVTPQTVPAKAAACLSGGKEQRPAAQRGRDKDNGRKPRPFPSAICPLLSQQEAVPHKELAVTPRSFPKLPAQECGSNVNIPSYPEARGDGAALEDANVWMLTVVPAAAGGRRQPSGDTSD